MSDTERRRKGLTFHRDDDGGHWTTAVVRTYQVGIAFAIQLAAMLAILWGALELKITPLVDSRIEIHDSKLLEEVSITSRWMIQHRAEVAVGLSQMEQYRETNDERNEELLSELKYIRQRVDELYARQTKR